MINFELAWFTVCDMIFSINKKFNLLRHISNGFRVARDAYLFFRYIESIAWGERMIGQYRR